MATLRTVQWWALAVGMGVGCSVNSAGLPGDGGPAPEDAAGTGGTLVGEAGVGTGSGGAPIAASGGDSGIGSTGSGGREATGGRAGSGGYFASGGSNGSGGSVSSGGSSGSGGRAVPASGGAPSSGGAPGTGGAATGGAASGGKGQSGGASATGGAATGGAATGGAGTSGAASGGAAATGGAGMGGRSGTGGRPGNCKGFPDATAFVPTGEDRAHCYWYRSEMRTWQAARMQCQDEMGGDLVTIRSEEENEFVHKLARYTNSPPEVWIGATDERAATNTMGPGTYRWVTSEAWGTYTNWNQISPKQPDGYCDPCNSGQACTCDHRGTMASDGTWYDFWQENARGYVCEALEAN